MLHLGVPDKTLVLVTEVAYHTDLGTALEKLALECWYTLARIDEAVALYHAMLDYAAVVRNELTFRGLVGTEVACTCTAI